ncbi:MAG: hypothetical protein Ct9H90mP11_00450 [Acidimicrobiales bacterium]|nr:MAG: hypothetical protein Ct9H90mP11_00450 [Acidimicrobiales bacterium]
MSLGLEVKTVSLDNLADLRALDQDSFPEPWSRSLWKLELSRPNRIYLGPFKGAELIGFIGGLRAQLISISQRLRPRSLIVVLVLGHFYS